MRNGRQSEQIRIHQEAAKDCFTVFDPQSHPKAGLTRGAPPELADSAAPRLYRGQQHELHFYCHSDDRNLHIAGKR
jgi:hypothetical protein